MGADGDAPIGAGGGLPAEPGALLPVVRHRVLEPQPLAILPPGGLPAGARRGEGGPGLPQPPTVGGGSWMLHRPCVRGLQIAGLNNRNSKQIAKYCSVSAILGSLHTWRRRCHLYP